MDKVFGFLKNILGFIGVVLILNILVNWLFLWENDGSKYVDKYMQESKVVNIKVKLIKNRFYKKEKITVEQYKELLKKVNETGNQKITEDIDVDFGISGESYIKYLVFYKGIKGGSRNLTIQDANTKRYYMIMRFDKYGDPLNTHAQSTELIDQEVYVTVDSVQYNDQNYGSRNNPIVVLKYKGVNNVFSISYTNDDGESYLRPIAPTEEEYRYNVENYLTYVMPKEEFNARFKD